MIALLVVRGQAITVGCEHMRDHIGAQLADVEEIGSCTLIF